MPARFFEIRSRRLRSAGCWLSAVALIVGLAIVFAQHFRLLPAIYLTRTSDDGTDYEHTRSLCILSANGLYGSASGAVARAPDAPTLVRVTVTKVWGPSPSQPISSGNEPTSAFVSVDEVIKGQVTAKTLFVHTRSTCVHFNVGDGGFLAGAVNPRNPSDPVDSKFPPSFVTR
jgi:hypothetical protein